MQKIILLSLFILTCSKLNTIEFDKEIPFDKDNNNVFEFTTQADGALFVSVTFPVSNLLYAKFHDGDRESISNVDKPGMGEIFSFGSGKTCKLLLEYSDQSSNEKGTIWMHLSTDEIKVDLNETYEWKYDYNGILLNNYPMIFSIDNAERDVTFIFKYNQKAKNPFEVCHGEECQKDITTYDFKKGESYKIYARSFPSFSFHDIDKEDESDSTDQTDSDSTDHTDSDSTDQTDSDSTDQTDSTDHTDSDSTDHTDSDSTDHSDGNNYSFYLSLNLLAISILLLSL